MLGFLLFSIVLGASEPMRFLALGDSYTAGTGLASPEQRWPELLRQQLNDLGLWLAKPRIIAERGWTTGELLEAMDRASLEPRWDLVSVQIGVNDQYDGIPAAQFRKQLELLLDRAIELAGNDPHRVLILSIPDWSLTRFAADSDRDVQKDAGEVDVFNKIILEQAAAAELKVFDVTALSREHPELVVADGLHPSAEQYRLWVESLTPGIAERLQGLVRQPDEEPRSPNQ